jgi:Big-like domain-containing protein/hemolysin type calcium-binding protein
MLKKAHGQLARRGGFAVLAAVGALCIGGASSAMAATVSESGANPVFTDDQGIADDLAVIRTAPGVVIFDDGIQPIASTTPDCATDTPTPGEVTCTVIGEVGDITINLGDGNDTTTLTNVIGTTTQDGGAGDDTLNGGDGADNLNGGDGQDILLGADGNDVIQADDGVADIIACGPGTDEAFVDSLDTVFDDPAADDHCETVNTAAVTPPPPVTRPPDTLPTVAFVSPAEGATLPVGSTVVTISASDDKGISKVTLFDGGKVVGADTTAPYNITYSPTAADIGSHTLVATATDTADQSASALRKVTVAASTGGSATATVTPKSVSAIVTPKRDRKRPYKFTIKGAVGMPAGVTKAQGCASGTVKVTGKRGLKTAFTKTAKLKKDCTYAVTATVTRKGRVKITARFSGNSALKAKSSLTRTVRAG